MGVVRVPYLLAELKERGCADESALAQVMQPGCRGGEEDLRKLAANLGLEVSSWHQRQRTRPTPGSKQS